MKYLKIFTDFAADIEYLSDAEAGRLFRAMMQYAETGTAPELRGNERMIWGTAKKNIDRQARSYSNKVDGAKKARSRRSDIRSNQNDIILISDQEKDKDNIFSSPLMGGEEKYIRKILVNGELLDETEVEEVEF